MLHDQRLTKEGVIVIKAQQYRSLENNREEALIRLRKFIKSVAVIHRQRRPTKPTRSSHKKRLDRKTKRGKTKVLRGKVSTGKIED